jgi:hypothetical protein
MNNGNIFLQLKQKGAEQVFGNGDYHTQLKQPITLQEGDEIICNKAIIDSQASSSGKVVLPNNTTFGFTFGYYNVKHNSTQRWTDPARGVPVPSADIDCDNYVLCEQFTHGGTSYDVYEIKQISYKQTEDGNTNELRTIQQYTAVNGDVRGLNVDCKFNKESKFFNSDPINVRIRVPLGQNPEQALKDLTSDAILKEFGTSKSEREINAEEISGTSFEPVIKKASVDFPAGEYDPVAFAQEFTRRITIQQDEPVFNSITPIAGNNLLITTHDLSGQGHTNPTMIKANWNKDLSGNHQYYYWGGDVSGVSAGENMYLGCPQFQLNFDEEAQRFKIGQNHFQYYDSEGNIQVEYVPVGSTFRTATDEFKLVSAEGGIFFDSFFASDDTSSHLNYWEDKLGFATTTMIATPKEYIDAGIGAAAVPNFGTNFRIGEQITTGNRGVDVAVVKTNSQQVPNLADPSGNFITKIGNQIDEIYASKDFTITALKYGYFLVSVDCGLTQDMITNKTIHNSIFSITSRYYQNGQFTTGTSADAVIYRHIGAPAYLNSLRVRILDDTYNVPSDLGDDNTIFLQLAKSPSNLPAVKDQKQ